MPVHRKLLSLFLALLAMTAHAQSHDPLFQQISSLDTALFDAYNHCDLEKLGSMVSDDLEFYHDKTGLSVGKQVFLDAIRKTSAARSPANWFLNRSKSIRSTDTAPSKLEYTASAIPEKTTTNRWAKPNLSLSGRTKTACGR